MVSEFRGPEEGEVERVFRELCAIVEGAGDLDVAPGAECESREEPHRETAIEQQILAELNSKGTALQRMIFGSEERATGADPSANCAWASERSRQLILVAAPVGERSQAAAAVRAHYSGAERAVVVETDFKQFRFTLVGSDRRLEEPFLELNAREAAADVAMVGSLWALVFPAHRAMLTRTIAFSVPRTPRCLLFDEPTRPAGRWTRLGKGRWNRTSMLEWEALARLKQALEGATGWQDESNRPARLFSLEELRVQLGTVGKTADVLSRQQKGADVFTHYAPPYSPLIRFGEEEAGQAPTRGDFVISYRGVRPYEEFHRGFLLSLGEWLPGEAELYRAALDVLHVLAIRRSGLFRLGFAQRVFTVLLPPAMLDVEGREGEELFVIPCLVFYQVPGKSTFRRTFTLSYVVVPVKKAAEGELPRLPRRMAIEDLRALCADLKSPLSQGPAPARTPRVHAGGPLAEMVGLDRGAVTVPRLVSTVAEFVVAKMLCPTRPAKCRGVASAMAFASGFESRLASMLLQVEWRSPTGSAQPWEEWLTSGVDRCFKDNVYKLMFYDDFLAPRSGYTSRRGVDLKTMLIGNALRTDMNGMTFLDPTEELKVILFPKERERYPNYSIVRWMGFSLYAESALSALQGMIQRFYVDLNQQGSLERVVRTLGEMLESFAELYDLDIRLYLYRQEYEKLRELLKVDRDFAFLSSKLASVKEDASLREQRLFNKLLVAFTVATTSIAVAGTVAQLESWPGRYFVGFAVPIGIGLTLAGYALFDRMRSVVSRDRG